MRAARHISDNRIDEPCDSRAQLLAESLKQTMLQDGAIMVASGYATDDRYELDDDVAQRVYEDHGPELIRLIRLMLIANCAESRAAMPDAENQLDEQNKIVLELAKARLEEVCGRAAEKQIIHGDRYEH